MGKPKAKRRLADNEVQAHSHNIRVSPQKLNLVAATIRGRKAEAAIADLTFNPRRVSNEVKKVLQSAIANAENNHGLDVDRLWIKEAYVGKSMVMKRWRARARGRVGRIVKPWSNLTIILQEREEAA